MGWRIIEDRGKRLNKGSDGRGNRKSAEWRRNERRRRLID
jgi:hypothetical protein